MGDAGEVVAPKLRGPPSFAWLERQAQKRSASTTRRGCMRPRLRPPMGASAGLKTHGLFSGWWSTGSSGGYDMQVIRSSLIFLQTPCLPSGQSIDGAWGSCHSMNRAELPTAHLASSAHFRSGRTGQGSRGSFSNRRPRCAPSMARDVCRRRQEHDVAIRKRTMLQLRSRLMNVK